MTIRDHRGYWLAAWCLATLALGMFARRMLGPGGGVLVAAGILGGALLAGVLWGLRWFLERRSMQRRLRDVFGDAERR